MTASAEKRQATAEYKKQWRKEHATSVKRSAKRYYESHKDYCKNKANQWRKNNPKRVLEYSMKNGVWNERIEFTAKWVEQLEKMDHYLDGIIEDATINEILCASAR